MTDPLHVSALINALVATYEPARRRRRPELGLRFTRIGRDRVGVSEQVIVERPFCRLIHFAREGERRHPRLLLVAPLSGHFSALLRDMVVRLLPDHDLYLADWTDARDVAVGAGPFGLDDNIAYVADFIRVLGNATHVVALCQSALPVVAATAALSASGAREAPRAMILVNGMLDARVSPTRIDRFAAVRPIAWFERNAVTIVPPPYRAAGREVYPATTQHAALVTYLLRHIASGGELLGKVLRDDGEDAAEHPFIEAYLSVMDLPARFVLDLVRAVFHDFALPRGMLKWRGAAVETAAIAGTGLMTVEAALDDVSAPGQTHVAHDLCPRIPAAWRAHHVEPGTGHFGAFHGGHWREGVLPKIAAFIRAMEARAPG